MRERLPPLPLFREYIGEIYKMPEIMDPPAGDQIPALLRQIQSFDQVIHQALVHLPVIDQPFRLAFPPVLQPLLDLLHQRRTDIIVDIDLRIPRHLEDPGLVGIITKIGKDIPQVVSDDIFQQDDMMLVHRRRGQQDEPAQHPAGHFDQRIFTLHAAIPARQDHRQINGLIPKIGEGGNALDHQWNGIGPDLLLEIVLNELLLVRVELLFAYQEDLFPLHLFADDLPNSVEVIPLLQYDPLDIIQDLL